MSIIKTHLSNGDGLTLVSESEPTELRIIGELLDTNGGGCLDQSNDFLALLRELRWPLRLAARGLVKVVQELAEDDLL